MSGVVKWFNNEKGYGFIEYKDNEDIFIHYSSIIDNDKIEINEGDIVEFEIVKTNNEIIAKNVNSLMKFVLDGKIVDINLLGKIKEKFISNEDNNKILMLVVSILGIVIPIICDNSTTENNITINCNNCEVNIDNSKINISQEKK